MRVETCAPDDCVPLRTKRVDPVSRAACYDEQCEAYRDSLGARRVIAHGTPSGTVARSFAQRGRNKIGDDVARPTGPL